MDIDKKIREVEDFRSYVERFALAAAGLEEFILISEEKEGDGAYFFEAMGVLARDKDTSSGEIIQFIPLKELVEIVAAEARAANTHLQQMEAALDEELSARADEDSEV